MADTLVGSMLTLGTFDAFVVEGSWVRRPDYVVGARVRVKDGTLRSSEAGGAVFPFLGSKMVFDCQVDLLDQAEENSLRAACPIGQAIAIAGYLVPVPFDGVVDVGDVATMTATLDGVMTIFRTASLHIEQA